MTATCSASSTLSFPLNDHLGSVVGVLDSGGISVSTQTYWPYGATRSGTVTQTDKLYTSQQIENGDTALGLYNYKARFYSTTLGRFVSADPMGYDSWNRYTYVHNNPVNYSDPTGYRCTWALDPVECLKAAADAAKDAANKAVDEARGVASGAKDAATDAAQAAWAQLHERVVQAEAYARATADFAWGLHGLARVAWRATYWQRAGLTETLAQMILGNVTAQEIRHVSGRGFGLAFDVDVVIGCGGPICDSIRWGGSDAFTVGHTIFTWWTAEMIEANPGQVLRTLFHELQHVAQFEDLGDAFWALWFGGGSWEVLTHCLNTEGCNLVEVWHRQYLERSAENGSYP